MTEKKKPSPKGNLSYIVLGGNWLTDVDLAKANFRAVWNVRKHKDKHCTITNSLRGTFDLYLAKCGSLKTLMEHSDSIWLVVNNELQWPLVRVSDYARELLEKGLLRGNIQEEAEGEEAGG